MKDDQRLSQLGQFTPEGALTQGYGDTYLFNIGRDDCHGIMHFLLTHESLEHDFNMYGYDDQQLNDDILAQIKNPSMLVQGTLDKTEAGGVHERAILAADNKEVTGFSNSIVVGQSQTHQISHTKAGVLVGLGIAYEGSMNWSAAGEGMGISLKADVKNPSGWRAQNNTLTITTNPVYIARLRTRLAVEHRIALLQQQAKELKNG